MEIRVNDEIFIRKTWNLDTDQTGWLKCMDDVRQSRHLAHTTLPMPYTKEFAIEQILENKKLCETQSENRELCVKRFYLPIIFKNGKTDSRTQVIGGILIRPSELLENSFESVEIGYAMDPDFQGKGLMSICMKTFLKYAFQRFCKLSEITAIISDENMASLRMVKRLGFERSYKFEPFVGKRHEKVLAIFDEKEELVGHGYSLKKKHFEKDIE